MPKYLIERDVPGAASLGPEELRETSRKSNSVLATLAPRLQWQETYVTGDKMFCVFLADSEDTVREHARLGGFPVTMIHRVDNVIDPTTGDE